MLSVIRKVSPYVRREFKKKHMGDIKGKKVIVNVLVLF